MLIVRENPGLPRTIHLDGRVHPHLSRWTPTAVGHSVGRYEGGALIVDTIGLATGNVTAGGWRTPETVLTERFRPSADGKRLTITYTWQDPKVYLKPHTYEIVAERTPPGSWAFEGWCDSSYLTSGCRLCRQHRNDWRDFASRPGSGGPRRAAPAGRDARGRAARRRHRRRPAISCFAQLSFDGRNVPRAELAAGVTPAVLAEQARKDAHAIRWCNFQGLPAAMDSPRPINIRQGRREVVVNFETVAAPRHIYLRASHPNMDEFDPTTSGDSIARWDGDTLVVDTLGFDGAKGLTAIPGGGFRCAIASRRALPPDRGGRVLSVTSTWEDPAVFKQPHTYEFRYVRASAHYEPEPPLACDPFDDERAAFLSGRPAPPAAGR